MAPIRLVLVGSDQSATDSLAAALAGRRDLEILGVTTPDDARLLVQQTDPDAVVWHFELPTVADLEGLRDLDAPAVILAGDARAVQGMLQAGRAALAPDASVEVITSALHAVLQGLVVTDPSLVPVVREQVNATVVEGLTPREHEVLQWLAEGLTNRQIASRLDLSEHTVKFHVDTILGKLGAHSRTEAVTRAARAGLITL